MSSFKTLTRQHRDAEAYTNIVFLPLKSHKHSIGPLLYSKTCNISPFIKGPFFSAHFSSLGLAGGFCCKLEQCIVFFSVFMDTKMMVKSKLVLLKKNLYK